MDTVIGRILMLLLVIPVPAVAQQRATVSATVEPAVIPAGGEATIKILVRVNHGFHAQSSKPLDENLIPFSVRMEPSAGFTFGEPVYPPGVEKEYEALGRLSVYDGEFEILVPVRADLGVDPGLASLSGTARFQLCDDQLCYAPTTEVFSASVEVAGKSGSLPPASGPSATAAPVSSAGAPTALPNSGRSSSNWSASHAFMIAIVAGLLFNVMPCVLPVLPIKAIGFYEAAEHSRSRSLFLGFMFSLGVTAIFAVLAVLVLGLRQFSWGSMYSNPWFIWSIAILLVGLALSLFGMLTFNLPGGAYSLSPRHDTAAGNFVWGGLTAILATPCTAPLLPPLLLWALAQPKWIGVAAVVMVGVGMALPYLILSALPEVARRFPRTGPWAELFKQMMGFMLLAAAAYFAGGRLIQGPGFWWLVVAVVACGSVFLVARSTQLARGAGAVGVCSVIAVALFSAVFWWAARVNGLGAGPSVGKGTPASEWVPYSDQAFHQAIQTGRPVLVKFTANWCATCQVIEGTVFRSPEVWDALRAANVVTLKADLTEENAPGYPHLLKLNPAGGIPLTAVYFPGREEPVVLSSIYTSGDLIAVVAPSR